ncbi:polysaccharide biosynthesis tyrosine autokinase [Pseudarthrobacter cellobiosi]|uniref:polysaccharide biosynthesis tyrosine autokinase n=1 Tax=Pseudarthrobacter cellobiosi TaxID=2953654 RepID=UPI00208DE82D|nr:polysaccharide biosynthesis tyrosine autokinase [Pseudarthrobacter sp. HLT1-5]MCO4254743.1 polysaccharide biosynthesis tyrosine autokinase [Pseudarthrobacter sp. HLT1-5]
MELKDYLRVVRQRWISIVAAALIGLALAAGYTYIQTPQYEAKSQLFVSVKGGATSTDVIQGNSFAEKRVTSYVSLATSPRVLQAVAGDLNLEGGALAGKVVATTPPQTVLIDITATATNPQLAADIANSSARQLIGAVSQVEDVTIVRLSVFQEATPSMAPSSPKVPLNLALGLLLGLMIGAASALLREVLDTRIRSQADVERTVKAGILGTFSTDSSVEKEPLVTQGDQFSHRAESFRQLRTHLHFTNISGGAQTVVVSSSIPGEGKTSTAVNLAIMLAESGTRVLLVDADLRRPRVAKYLGVEGSVGLSGVLSHSVELEDAIQTWGRGGALHVLASGRSAPNPSELLGSPTMEKLIARFEAEYEVVIIDAPPLLPVTDPAVLGSMASGVVLVASADGRTNRADLTQAVANLEAVNARLLGVVVNRLERSASAHSYYDYRPEFAETGKRGKSLPKKATFSSQG